MKSLQMSPENDFLRSSLSKSCNKTHLVIFLNKLKCWPYLVKDMITVCLRYIQLICY